MSARIPPGFAEMWLQCNIVGDNENMYVSMGIEKDGGTTASQAATDAILTEFRSVRNLASVSYTFGPGYMIWGNDGGDIRIDSTISPQAGTRTGNSFVPNTAILVTKLTASGGRRGRGRFYVPGPSISDVDQVGNITSGALSSMQTSIDAVRSNLLALTQVTNVVLFHDSAPFTPTVVTDLDVEPRVATQRRRLRP